MEELNIRLNYERRFFEEIFFRDNHRNAFVFSNTRDLLAITILLGTAALCSFFYRLLNRSDWGAFVFLFILFCIFLSDLDRRTRPYFSWKKDVQAYLDSLEECSRFRIKLTEECIHVFMDDTEYVERWSGISKIKVAATYIEMWGGEHYLIPLKTMEAQQFEALAAFARRKITRSVQES